jgi:hypothetical protein
MINNVQHLGENPQNLADITGSNPYFEAGSVEPQRSLAPVEASIPVISPVNQVVSVAAQKSDFKPKFTNVVQSNPVPSQQYISPIDATAAFNAIDPEGAKDWNLVLDFLSQGLFQQ